MKLIRKIYHFLGGIYFALMLIGSAAIFVIAGTFLESFSDSHRYAALFTYQNPLFLALLWGFFVNILFSALRRWPFKSFHIPFLITHFGLLMILGGILIKSYYGTQGTMSLSEGSAGQEVFLPDTYVLRMERRDQRDPLRLLISYYDLNEIRKKMIDPSDGNLAVSLVEHAPHSFERMETWIKGDQGFITGFKPFPVHEWTHDAQLLESFPISSRVRLVVDESAPWDIYAGRTSDVELIAMKVYVQGMDISIRDYESQKELFHGTLREAIDSPILLPGMQLTSALHFDFSVLNGFTNPRLHITAILNDRQKEQIDIPLQGPDVLQNHNLAPYLGSASISIDLHRTPALLFLQDLHDDTFLFAFGPSGQVHSETFHNDTLNAVAVYDRGFGGYAVQAHLPQEVFEGNRIQKEKISKDELISALKKAAPGSLVPPLSMLHHACEACHADFASVCAEFLHSWNHRGGWLYPQLPPPPSFKETLKHLDWKSISQRDRKACFWVHALFAQFDPELIQGVDFLDLLKQRGWPLISKLQTLETPAEQLTAFTQQIFSIADQLPDFDEKEFSADHLQARLLSGYLRAYSIHLHDITPPASSEKTEQTPGIYLEAPLTWRQYNAIPSKKLESNLPKITLKIQKGSRAELVALSYDRFGQGLKRPILGGEYLIRFQQRCAEIPYKIRLREARQINYANSSQPYSYESDLIVTDLNEQSVTEKTISMNNVHETWDGFRFYLSNITPPNESSAKRIQLVVNHDPAKYWLTYPGAIILSFGILLLFWFRK